MQKVKVIEIYQKAITKAHVKYKNGLMSYLEYYEIDCILGTAIFDLKNFGYMNNYSIKL